MVATLRAQRDTAEVTEVHVILSADSGQKAFRVNVTVLLVAGRKVVFEKHILVGHVECNKETRDLLDKSGVLQGINASLASLKEAADNFDKNLHKAHMAGRLSKAFATKRCFPCCKPLVPFPVKLFVVGDLAWYAVALGKENMSAHHCFRCKTMAAGINKDPFKKGATWTLEGMKEHYEKLERGELRRTRPEQQRGLTKPMLIDCVEPENYLSPVLHAVTLFINTPFKYLKKYMWYRAEDLPLQLLMARDDLAVAVLAVETCRNDMLDAGEWLNNMRIELDGLQPQEYGAYDDDQHRKDFLEMEAVVNYAKDQLEEKRKAHEKAESELRSAKAHVNKLDKDKTYGRMEQGLWLQVESMLKDEFGIYQSSYHGGDMEGNHCRKLVSNAPSVMKRIRDIILEHISNLPQDEKASKASPVEIGLYCDAFERVFQYMDLISHYAYQPYGSMSDEDVEDAKRAIDLATRLWQRLQPTIPMKVHVWQHLKDDIEKYRGLGQHTEQQIERAHQVGKKHERRLVAVKNFKCKTVNILKHNSMEASTEVMAMVADTKAKQKPRRGAKRKRNDEVLVDRAGYLKSILQLPELTSDFQELRELLASTYQQRQQHQ